MTESRGDPLLAIGQLSGGNNAAIEKVRDIRCENELAMVDAVCPQWRQLVNSEPFEQWFARQSDFFRELGQSPLAIDLIRLLDCFIRENAHRVQCGEPTEDRVQSLERTIRFLVELNSRSMDSALVPLNTVRDHIAAATPVVEEVKRRHRAQAGGLARAQKAGAKVQQIGKIDREEKFRAEALVPHLCYLRQNKHIVPPAEQIYDHIVRGESYESGLGGRDRALRLIRKIVKDFKAAEIRAVPPQR